MGSARERAAAEDERAVRALVARYADAVNRRDADDWSSLWCADGIWQAFGRRIQGREAVAAAWLAAMQGFGLVFHGVHGGVVELAGDGARGRFAVSEHLQGRDGTPGLLLALYHDDYRREASGWRFARRELEVLYHGPADLSGAPAAR